MTSHEVELAGSPDDFLDSKDYGDKAEIDSLEVLSPVESAKSSSKSISEDDHGEIVWHYLWYETKLPAPSSFHSATPDASPPPDAPDLSTYINPFDWSPARKNVIIWLSCVATFCVASTAGAYAPGISQMMDYFHVSKVAALTGITIFTCGFGVAPMVLAPFSELNGRRPVFLATGALFFICQICCAVTKSFGGLLVARFFVGVGGSTFSTLVGGCVSDIYHKKVRATPVSIRRPSAIFTAHLFEARLTAS